MKRMKNYILLYFTRQFIYFLIAGGSAALINFITRIMLRPYLDIILSAVLAYSFALVLAFFLYRKLVFTYSTSPIRTQGVKFILVQLVCMPIVIYIFSTLSGVFLYMGLGQYSESIAHVISIGLPALITFLFYKLFIFIK